MTSQSIPIKPAKWLKKWQSNGVQPNAPELLYYQFVPWQLDKMQSKQKTSEQFGLQLSQQKGRGLEFSEVRTYQIGDDVRSIDWRVTARTGVTHTKLYHEERESPVYLSLDLRAPMFFGSQLLFKSLCAGHVAAALGWGAVQSGKALGGCFFNETQYEKTPLKTRPNAMFQWIETYLKFTQQTQAEIQTQNQAIEQSQTQRMTYNLQQQLHTMLAQVPAGSTLYLISDFHDFNQVEPSLLLALKQRFQLIAIQITDPIEQILPAATSPINIRDALGTLELPINNKEFRENFAVAAQERQLKLEQLMQEAGVLLIKLSAASPIELQLLNGYPKQTLQGRK